MVRSSVYVVPTARRGWDDAEVVVITRRRRVHMRYMRVRLLMGWSVAVCRRQGEGLFVRAQLGVGGKGSWRLRCHFRDRRF